MSADHPLPGDVLVSRIQASEERYLLSRYPGDGQFTFASYESAFRMARRFAEKYRVAVWYAAGPSAPTRIASYRSPEIAG